MNTVTSTLVGLVLVIGVGGLVYFQLQGDTQPAGTPSVNGSSGTDITAATVAQHASRESCWSSINGGVYDLTSWIPQHPGGEQAILQLCGTDGSAKFNGMHGGSVTQESILAGFKIGALAQ